ncbi:MAG: ACT domain-containing protein [Candidatus Nitrosotenuis sp.]
MRTANLSVPEAIRDIITKNRSIYDCMKMDVINYTALAVKIQPEVERQLGNPVNLNTVVVAIKRYADSFLEKEDVKSESVLKNARLSLTDGILDIRFSANDMDKKEAASLLNKFEQYDSDYEFFRLADSNFRVLTEDLVDIRRMFESFPAAKNFFSSGLAKIKIRIPQDQDRSDAVSYVAELLHNNGIETQNAFFSQDDIILVLKEEDASKAYEVLRAEISR